MNQKNYWLIHLGQANKYAELAKRENFIALGWQEISLDLTPYKTMERRDFSQKLNEKVAKAFPDKTNNFVGAVVGQLFRFAALMKPGDIILMPGQNPNRLFVGEIVGGYEYIEADECPFRHRRSVKWVDEIDRSTLSEGLRNSAGSIMTVFSVSDHATEIEGLISSDVPKLVVGEDIESIEDFGLEKHLEEFLIYNWDKTKLAKDYVVYKDESGQDGQQYITEAGRIDILAKSKDNKKWLIIELKKGRSGDAVVGQTLRYMGYVKANLAEANEEVEGLIITGEDDMKIRYAISTLPNVKFLTYKVHFELN